MSDVLARAAEVLGAHVQVTDNPDMVALCSCGIGGMVRALEEVGPWYTRHLAQVLADAGLLADDDPHAGHRWARAMCPACEEAEDAELDTTEAEFDAQWDAGQPA